MVNRNVGTLLSAAVTLVVITTASERSVAASKSKEADTSAPAKESVLANIDRHIAKEPKYAGAAKYALLVLGTKAEAKVWIVEDGETLYVDRNGDGDLTDDGPPVQPSEKRQLGELKGSGPRWDFDYVVGELSPADGSHHKDLKIVRWNYGPETKGYGISVTVDGKTPMYAGWTSFWAATAEKAAIIHFGGKLNPHMLRFNNFVLNSGTRRLSMSFVTPGRGKGSVASLNIEALPATIVPVLAIDWPVAKGAPPLRETYPLKERCCYWEFYEPKFQVPAGAAPGTAKVTVSFIGGVFPYPITTNQFNVPVVAHEATPAAKE